MRLAENRVALPAFLSGVEHTVGTKGKRVYRARVIGSRKGFAVESAKALEFGEIVKNDGTAYRVAYVIDNGAKSAVVLVTPRTKAKKKRKQKKAK